MSEKPWLKQVLADAKRTHDMLPKWAGGKDYSHFACDSRPQRHMWAPGGYMCHCMTCNRGFAGDKRATMCADCAYAAPDPVVKTQADEIKEYAGKLVLKPKHKWFAHVSPDAEDGWDGPHDHIDDAAKATLLSNDWLVGEFPRSVWIAQGYKMSKQERDEKGVEYAWEVDTRNTITITL